MGEKLVETTASKSKIFIHFVLRFLICFLFMFIILVSKENGSVPKDYGSISYYIRIGSIILVLFLYSLSPFRHMWDKLIFYERGIMLNKKKIEFTNSNQIGWSRYQTYIFGNRIQLFKRESSKAIKNLFAIIFKPSNELDVTYLKEPQEHFVKAYMNHL